MDISEQELEHIKELLFTGDIANIKLVDVILKQRLKFRSRKYDFFKEHIYAPYLRYVSISPLDSGVYSFFKADVWDYVNFFELLQTYERELAFVHGKEIFNGCLNFNLKCQKCKLIYFPSEVLEEFVSLVNENRPDIEVKIYK